MKLEMNKNSIFAILLRSPWWISAAISAGIFAVFRLLLPEAFAPYAFFVALPIMVISFYAAWGQLRSPGSARVAETLATLRELSWKEFSALIEEAYRREGYTVGKAVGGADFELVRADRVSLVSCKRWKAARTGIEPLRELESARHARGAAEGIYVAAGDISETASAFAAEKGLRLVHGAELAKLLPGPRGTQKS
jgi:restriction system protein